MRKARYRLLKEAYPVLLFISLLMTWELASQGSPADPASSTMPAHPWLREILKTAPTCKLAPALSALTQQACASTSETTTGSSFGELLGKTNRILSPKASAGWESL